MPRRLGGEHRLTEPSPFFSPLTARVCCMLGVALLGVPNPARPLPPFLSSKLSPKGWSCRYDRLNGTKWKVIYLVAFVLQL